MPNENRELATIQEIKKIEPIENADALEKATVLGWDVVVRKGEFKEGQKVVYFEIDSFLPIEDRFEFLRNSSYKRNELVGEGFRIKTIKLRGQVSQGLILPVEQFPELGSVEVGNNVTGKLNVKLFQVPEKVQGEHIVINNFHEKISKTDEIRVQSQPERLEILQGQSYYITEKIDGMSTTISYEKDRGVRIFTRNIEIKDDPKDSLWKFFRDIGLVEALEKTNEDIYFQGELFGPGIQKNVLKQKQINWKWFNIGYIEDFGTRRIPKNEWKEFFDNHKDLEKFRNEHVKILEEGNAFSYSYEDLQEISKGNYDGAGQREGIVIRPKEDLMYKNEPLSMKVINNKYLLKHDE